MNADTLRALLFGVGTNLLNSQTVAIKFVRRAPPSSSACTRVLPVARVWAP